MKESSPVPGTSVSAKSVELDSLPPDDIHILVKSEKQEIDQLKLPNETPMEPPLPAEEDDRIPRINFHCDSCEMNEMVHYKGTEPPFVFGVKLTEQTFIMRDPFQPHPPRWRKKPEFFICLGAHCCLCDRIVCKDVQCSFYYGSTFCLNCAKEALKNFPVEVQTKLRKQLSS